MSAPPDHISKSSVLARLRMPIVLMLIFILAITGAGIARFGNPIRSILSIHKVNDHPVYVMTYYGDYHFSDYLKTGDVTALTILPARWACTGFAALNANSIPVFGRNFDWTNDPILVLKTDPPDGFASISIVDARFLGLDLETITFEDRLQLLEAPYLPFDGMNEMGLAVGMMAVDVQPPHYANKVTIGSLQAIRLMLDRARNVNEAVNLMSQYNIDFQGGPGIHYLISDRSGHSAVVEYTGGKMSVLTNTQSWQVATNFNLSGLNTEQSRSSCWRYKTADEKLEQTNGTLTMDEAMQLLKGVSQSSTLWSVVYNLQDGKANLAIQRNYETIYPFKIKTTR